MQTNISSLLRILNVPSFVELDELCPNINIKFCHNYNYK